jgi:hypothetical protein
MLDQVNELSLMGSPALGLCNVAVGATATEFDLEIWCICSQPHLQRRRHLTDAEGNTWLCSDGYTRNNVIRLAIELPPCRFGPALREVGGLR